MQSTVKDKVVVVTGGSRGYGAGIAGVLRENGADVWITGRDRSALEKTADRLGVHCAAADVTSPADWDRVFGKVLGDAGRLDILVNNAGGGGRVAPITRLTDQDIADIIAVNLTGHLFGSRRAAEVMQKQKSGIIINISSVCAAYAWPGWGPYSAAKAGINQFGHCLYTELRESGIRVTTITPSWGATDFVSAAAIEGHPAADSDIRAKILQPAEMGMLVLNVCCTPAHLVLPDITVQPLVQQIEPM
jgi:NAD(P)-dependent dehydrogenase (short-subunit alcohol dehydrogenase family)